jgi:NAD(P)-dependent dehydrogenase (short-subunit alcohol dehydrogenase family)
VNGRTEVRVAEAVDRLRGELSNAVVHGIAADLSGGEGCRALIGRLPDVDVLVNNLGIFEPEPFEQIPERISAPDPRRDPLRHDKDRAAGCVTRACRDTGRHGHHGEMAAARGVDAAAVEWEFFATARPSSVLQRFATPDEVAAMITYVCSVRASATTGAALRVDGGAVGAIA